MGAEENTNRPPAAEGKREYRLGIMGGTFNPIHYGHLVAAEQARATFSLDEVIFVPSGIPPHKHAANIADSEMRYLMTVLATSTNTHFSVSRTEIDREGPSYAVDTIRGFLEQYSERKPVLYFITGTDAVMEILTWRKPETIMKLCTIIAASRPGYSHEKLKTIISPEHLKAINLLEVSALAISSTDIRERISAQLPIKYLLPESVEHFIEKHSLYI